MAGAGPAAFLSLALLFRISKPGGAGPVDAVEAKYTALLRAIAAEVKDRYDRSKESMAECRCSWHMCGNEFPGSRCMDMNQEPHPDEEIARLSENLIRCEPDCGHRRVNMESTAVTTPSNIINEDPNLSPEVVEDICMTQGMEEALTAIHNYTGQIISSTLIASARSGTLRMWPLFPLYRNKDGACFTYDPRLTSWYKAATSEPKKVVIIVQAGSSMSQPFHHGGGGAETQWDVAKKTVKGILRTLDHSSDDVGVIAFNSRATPLGANSLMKASMGYIEHLEDALDNVTLLAGTDNARAFETAFDMFERGSPGCQNIIIHIGNGEDCTTSGDLPCSIRGPKGSEDPISGGTEGSGGPGNGRLPAGIRKNLEAVEARQNVLERVSSRAAVFTLTMDRSDDGLARQLACANGGAWFRLDGRGEPLNNMPGYFQFLAFAMEFDTDRNATFTPLVTDYRSLSKRTDVAYPVFVKPKCANGTSSERKRLLGVIAKAVPLGDLKEDGLGEEQVENLINENLGRVRVCNEVYEYDNCKLQEMRGPMSECPARSWKAPDGETCYAFRGVRYVLVAEPTGFEEARQRCKDMGGRLAEPKVEEIKDDLHFFASIAPPDGVWIGLKPDEKWRFLSSSQAVPDRLEDHLWFRKPPITGNCRGAYADPRGTHGNVGSRLCNDETAFLCQFDETAQPEACQANVTVVLPESLRSDTAEGCTYSSGCARGFETEPTSIGAVKEAICDLGDPKSFEELICCSADELEEVCEVSTVQFNLTGKKGRKASIQGGGLTQAETLTVTLVALIVCALLAALILLVHHAKPKALSTLYGQFFKSRSHVNVRDPNVGVSERVSNDVEEPSPAEEPCPAEEPRVLELMTLQESLGEQGPQPLPLANVDDVVLPEGGQEFPGGHGVVQKGTWVDEHGTPHTVAVKRVNSPGDQKCLATINREVEILASLPPHPNVVRVIGVRPGREPVIVEEWMPMTLRDLLKETGPGPSYGEVAGISLDVAKGLSHLHKHRVTHYDVKPANILLDEGRNAKLADFTCSVFKASSIIEASLRGTMGYMAPECVSEGITRSRHRVRADKIDVYSLGKVMSHCVTGDTRTQWSTRAVEKCPGCLRDLIRECMDTDPKGRPDCQKLVERLEGMLEEGEGGAEDWKEGRPKRDIWCMSLSLSI